MVVATPATIEEGRILLVGNETDILHSAFGFPINEGGKRYPSADHYAHAQILTQLGLDEVHILALLATANVNVAKKARELLRQNMPAGHDMNSLAQYLVTSRQSYTMMGLRFRAEQDKRFRLTLMETGDALLIVCDRRDPELGIGMDDETFVTFARRRMANAEMISAWMHDEKQRPKELGQNQLGFFLMWLRYELREKEKAKWLSTIEIKVEGLSTDQDDKPVEISVSDFMLTLQGIFQPLSNYYAMPFELKGDIYRSIEHYAYQRLFEALRLPPEEAMKLRTTVLPADVAKVANRVFSQNKLDPTEVEHKSTRLDRWRQSAMKHKIMKNDYLQKLLLSTGHAFILETTAEADPQWACGTDELEMQHLLSKKYITPQLLVKWMCGREKLPSALAHLGGNKTGLLLMELRAKLATTSTHKMPLISPLVSSVLRSSVSNHMICFSPESVLHPFYPAELRLSAGETFPSAVHLAAHMAISYFDLNQGDANWIVEAKDGPECWERLHTVLCEQRQFPMEKIQQWYAEERQNALKEAMKLQFEQHPPLLRVLLDTKDALLVSCARFTTVEAELNIGIRERDLRLWLTQVRQDTKQLMDLCLRPLALRPPYLGGNRLGFLLMELRREFILTGVFPQHLPELAMGVDALLGSESPMENYVPTVQFDVLDESNFTAIWANPYLLMLKQQERIDENQWAKATSTKQTPILISRDEHLIGNIFSRLFLGAKNAGQQQLQNGGTEKSTGAMNGGLPGMISIDEPIDQQLEEVSPEVLRSVYMKMTAQFRTKISEMDELQRQIHTKSRDSIRLLDMRKAMERTREHLAAVEKGGGGNTTGGAGLPPPATQPPGGPDQITSSGIPLGQQSSTPSSAQWTQAAAMSARGNELAGPPPKIPSLLPELFPPTPIPPPPLQHHHQRGPPLPPQQQTFKREHPSGYGGGTQGGEHRRTPRWERGGGGRPRARGGSRGGQYTSTADHRHHSQSPPPHYGGGRRGGPPQRQPISPVRVSSGGGGGGGGGGREQSPPQRTGRQQPPYYQQKQKTAASSNRSSTEQLAKPATTTPAPVAPVEPALKKPKRVVDESELSEGEILSDDE